MLRHYAKEQHILEFQKSLEDNFQARYQEKEYTPENPLIILNPYKIAPLTALIMFHSDKAVACKITIKGKDKDGDFSAEFPSTCDHILPVYGLYAAHKNIVEVTLTSGKTYSYVIETPAAPEKVKIPTSIYCEKNYLKNELMFLSTTSEAYFAGYDYAGDCRWYCTLNLVFAFKRFKNGHIFVGTERLIDYPYRTTGLYEMSLLGKIYAEYRIPGGYHHDHMELPNGDIVILTQNLQRGTVEDMCVLIDRTSGEIKKTWDYTKILPSGVGSFSKNADGHDWCHNNAVWYDEKTDSLTLSGRNLDALFNIDFQTGNLNWILGDPEQWPKELTDKYFFTPIGDNFEWFYGQHSCMILPDGDVMLLDNGCWRSKKNLASYPGGIRYSRGVRYHLNLKDKTVKQVWQRGKELGEKYFAPNVSNVDYYDEDHYMVHIGSNGFLHGKVCERTPVSYSGEDAKNIIYDSITTEVKNNRTLFEIHVPASYYRAKKLSLYTQNEDAHFVDGKLLGEMMVTPETRMKIKVNVTDEIVPEKYELVIVEQKDRIFFNALFETGEMVQVLLTDQNGTIHRYTYNTVPERVVSMCVGTFKKADPRNVDLNINKIGLQGTFDIQIIIGQKLYNTGVTVTI